MGGDQSVDGPADDDRTGVPDDRDDADPADDGRDDPPDARRDRDRRTERRGLLPRLSVGDGNGEGIDRRRLIRWIAALAFAIPIAVELLTFGGLFTRRLLGDGGDGGVGVGDELLAATAATETVLVSEVRESGDRRTYVLRVNVENDTDAPVELRLGALRLADGATVAGTSSTGTVQPGASGEVTGAWGLDGGDPDAVAVTALRDGEVVHDGPVAVAV